MKICQRPAKLSDASTLLKWRNDPRVRDFSVNSLEITEIEHINWFTKRLSRQELEPFLFFESNGRAVAVARLDKVPGENENFEISILVDPNFQGYGIGTNVLRMTCESFFSYSANKTIIATVHRRNVISQKLFENEIFQRVGEDNEFFYYEKRC